MKRFTFTFDDKSSFDTIAPSFRQACLNADCWLTSLGKRCTNIQDIKEWDNARSEANGHSAT